MATAPVTDFKELKIEQYAALAHDTIQVPQELQGNVAVTTLDAIYNWSRKSSMWPLLFGLACCAIEMIATAASRFDLSRFGMEVMRPSPRQADLMIVSGTVTKKMVPAIVRIYDQMAEPRYVLAMGACATGGGPFKEGYSVVSGIDKYIPVDVYVPGCPPTPEALIYGILKLHEKVERQSITKVPWYRRGGERGHPRADPGAGHLRPAQGAGHQGIHAGRGGSRSCRCRPSPRRPQAGARACRREGAHPGDAGQVSRTEAAGVSNGQSSIVNCQLLMS